LAGFFTVRAFFNGHITGQNVFPGCPRFDVKSAMDDASDNSILSLVAERAYPLRHYFLKVPVRGLIGQDSL
jgi:hypothetical protein